MIDVEGDHVGATALHLERPEAVHRRHVEAALAGQVLGDRIVLEVRAVVEHPLGDHAVAQLERVVPGIAVGRGLQP